MLSPYHPKIKALKDEFNTIINARLTVALFAFMMGILLYFNGCSLIFSVCCLCVSLIGWVWKRKNQIASFFIMFILFVSLGCLFGYIRVWVLEHPVLDQPIYRTNITANVLRNIALPEKQILDLEHINWPIGIGQRPEKIRLTFYETEPLLNQGDRVSLSAHILPPHGIQAPFQQSQSRRLYFEKVGAVGKVEKVLFVQPVSETSDFFYHLRHKISQRLFEVLPENQARIAIPLITGEQHFVSRVQYQNYRRSGIAHVLSVSGFHMALLAAFLFFLIRSFCVLTRLTLYINAKKISAFVALIGTLFYLALSDFQIPAMRSFGMIALVFLGILTDRKSFSIRSLILVGFLMLLWAPENLLSISFQLSFMSVLILISVHEKFKKFHPEMNKHMHRFLEFILLNIAITIGLSPLIVWHFNQFMPYGLLGNMMFSFVFSFGIMPLLFTGCLLMPFGLDSIFFKSAGYLLESVEQFSSALAQWPYSEIAITSFSPWALCLIILGIIALFCGYYWGRRLGCVLLILGFIVAFFTDKPAMIISGQSIAYIQDDHFYQNKQGNSWLQNLWRQKLGYSKTQKVDLPDIVNLKGKKIALSIRGCLGADYAILSHADSRCRIPIFIPKKGEVYLIYIVKNQVEIRILSE